MNLYHVSPTANRCSIRAAGLLKGRATGKRKAVWVCEEANRWWALDHVACRHAAARQGMDVWRVRVPLSLLKGGPKAGTYYVPDNIPADWLTLDATYQPMTDIDSVQAEG